MRFGLVFLTIALACAVAAPPSPNALFADGLKAMDAQEWDKALALLETALSAEPDNLQFGSEYRRAILSRARTLHAKEGRVQDFDRALTFFGQLVEKDQHAANAYLNYGFAYVDKIPAAGSITQVILANTALAHFTKSIEIQPSWIALYTRGVSYLFWPKIFGRAKLGVADLEQAMQMQEAAPMRPYYVRTWIALGDGYWKMDELEHARSIWKKGLHQFPGNANLRQRLAKEGDDLKSLIEEALDPNRRVDTDLKDMWLNP
jgi:tetratricopeptide (TPR) repeat protein